jgi:hypothetical protein
MAITTAANYQDLAKEVWDSDTMVKEFYDENPWLDMIVKKQRVVIGKRAQVPMHTDRAGGTTVHDAGGGNINPASPEVVDRAEYTLTYNYFPVSVEVGLLNEITGGAQSIGDGLEHTMSSGLNNMRNQVTRQFLTGHGRIAQTIAGAADTTVLLAPLASVNAGEVSGADATGMGWLRPGDVIDIGTSADYDSRADNLTVVSYNDDPAAPSLVVSASVTEAANEYVSLHDVRGAAGTGTLKESAGVITIAGTRNNVVGNIDANTNPFWNPAEVDSSATVPDMELLLRLSRKVKRRGGKGAFILTSLLQLDNVYQMLQTQVRFNGDREIGAGGSEQVKWRGNLFHAFPQVPENLMAFLDMDALEIVVGKYTKPTWMSDIGGGGRGGHWVPGTTHFDDTVMYALGLAARQRNNMAAATNLKA